MNCSPTRRGLPAQDDLHDLARTQGGNWNRQGFWHSGHDHDEGECQMSIAEFMDDRMSIAEFMDDTQGRHLIVE
jgi:hypothetical protein